MDASPKGSDVATSIYNDSDVPTSIYNDSDAPTTIYDGSDSDLDEATARICHVKIARASQQPTDASVTTMTLNKYCK